jgi:hypothetical protein
MLEVSKEVMQKEKFPHEQVGLKAITDKLE